MRTFAIILTIFLTIGCANYTAFNIQNESNSKTAKVDSKDVDNTDEKYKHNLEDKLYRLSTLIMKDEVKISKSKSTNDILKYIENIKTNLDKSFDIIKEYSKKSKNKSYQQYIKYVRCTYKAIYKSYDKMESFIEDNQGDYSKKQMNQLKDKMRSDTSKFFMKNMKKCEKIR